MKPKTPELMKFKRLCRRLGESKRGAVGLLELLWLSTATNCPQGDIGRFSNEDIAIMCEWDGDPDALVDALLNERWLDPSEKHRLIVHDWHEHAPMFVHGNLKRWGKEFARDDANGSVPATITEEVPPTPDPTPDPEPPPPPEPEWEAAEAALIAAGVGTAPALVESLIDRGCHPVAVGRVIAHWRAKAPAWEVGGLVHRLRSLSPGQNLEDPNLWPPPSKAAQQSENTAERERQAAVFANTRRINEAVNEANEAYWADLEQKHGAQVDVMERDEIRSVALERLGATTGGFLTKKFKLPLVPGTLREAMLEHFAGLPVEAEA